MACKSAWGHGADRRATGLISFKLSGSRWPPTHTPGFGDYHQAVMVRRPGVIGS
jgi:hypothetical protein